MLTIAKIKSLKPKDKVYRVSDGNGLYLEVNPNGSMYWRQKYRFAGSEKRLAHGVYGVGGGKVSVTEARAKALEAKDQLKKGIDPGTLKKLAKITKSDAANNSFEFVAREWFIGQSQNWAESHSKRTIARLENNVFPWIGNQWCKDIEPPELLAVLRRVEGRGALETAHRIKQICGQVFRYAVATGRATRDPSRDLTGALPPYQKKHFPTITDPERISDLLHSIDGYKGSLVTVCALKFASMVFVRPGELRHAEWKEVDLAKAEWRIPKEKMKMKRLHLVPLSTQAIDILKEIQPLTGNGKFVFPSTTSRERPISDNTLTAAIRRLGFGKSEFVVHGFRSMASTILNEHGFSSDAIERQLAHIEANKIRGTYNHAEYLPERITIMQWWADFLDELNPAIGS